MLVLNKEYRTLTRKGKLHKTHTQNEIEITTLENLLTTMNSFTTKYSEKLSRVYICSQ